MSIGFDEANRQYKNKEEYLYKFSKMLIPLNTVSQVSLERFEIIDIKANLLIGFLEKMERSDFSNNFYKKVKSVKQFKYSKLLNTKNPTILSDNTFNFSNIDELKEYIKNNFHKFSEVDELPFLSIIKNLDMLLIMATNSNKERFHIDEMNNIIYESIVTSEIKPVTEDRKKKEYTKEDRKINKTSFYIISNALINYIDLLKEGNIKFHDGFILDLFYKFMTDNSNFIKEFTGVFDDSNSTFIRHLLDNKISIDLYSKYISKTILNKDFHGRTQSRIKRNLIDNLSNLTLLIKLNTGDKEDKQMKLDINNGIINRLIEEDYFTDEEKLELKRKIMEAKINNS